MGCKTIKGNAMLGLEYKLKQMHLNLFNYEICKKDLMKLMKFC